MQQDCEAAILFIYTGSIGDQACLPYSPLVIADIEICLALPIAQMYKGIAERGESHQWVVGRPGAVESHRWLELPLNSTSNHSASP